MSSSKKGNTDSQLNPAPSEDALVFPSGAEPTDDTPTIISKKPPDAPEPATAISTENLAGSLRGRKLAHFELIAPIGVGGMAAVLRARDSQLDRYVALKILPPALAQDVENVRRFHQEARAAAKLDHENIARVFFCGEDQKLHFIAFEFVEGENLRTLLERRGKLPVGEAIRYVLQVAAGLEHAAARGIVHRDVKPSNIIITPSGRAKLVDMGLARSTERKADQDLTQSGITLGTFDYMSPEQAVEPRDADTRSDIYSLGCTLYHMLTGRPPVPEGAAGMKLLYHQQMLPQDPRELNPDIPDEVARILHKMMAKDPAERYQRPVELVQHLLRVAPKVGAADDVPEGVLFVDAPVAGAPRHRPLVLISAALAGLAVVLLLHSLIPPDKPVPQRQPTPSRAERAAPGPAPQPPVPVVAVTPVRADLREVSTEADLAALLRDPADHVQAQVKEGTIEIGSKGLTYQGRSKSTLVLESAATSPDRFPVLRFGARRAGKAGLTIDKGTVTLRRLRFELTPKGAPLPGMAALAVSGPATVIFEECVFVQVDVPGLGKGVDPVEQPLLASLLVESGSGEVPEIVLEKCLFEGVRTASARPLEASSAFAGGQAAIAIKGPADIKANNCAFMPHDMFFHIRPGCEPVKTQIKLRHCSGFVVNGPAFLFDKKASCRLRLERSILSRPENQKSFSTFLEPDLIRLTDDTASPIFEGTHNFYHNLNALWARPGKAPIAAYDDFKHAVENAGGKDSGSELKDLAQGPWVSTQPLDEAAVTAFRVYQRFAERGLEVCAWGKVQPEPDPAETIPEPPPGRSYKIVDEGGTGGGNVFKNLTAALASADDGDIILLKHAPAQRELELSPAALDPRRAKNVTLRPYPKHQPILTLDRAIRTKDVPLFHVPEGTLTFEQLHLVLEPEREGFLGRSIVQLGEGAQCVFKDCVVTLKPPSLKRLPMRVVSFDDPDRVMKMGPATVIARTQVRMTNCFIRGEGDLIDMANARALDVALDNCLIVLSGSLLSLQPADKESAVEPRIEMALGKVATFLAEPVLSLHAGKAPTHVGVKAEACLFASLTERHLVLLDTPDALNEESLKKHLDWSGKANCYANFGKLFEHQQRPLSMLENIHWKEVFPEADSRHEQMMIFPLQALEPPCPLWESRPELCKPSEPGAELFPYGAMLDLGPLLPAPETKE
jgi:predicted Ser/Thr protein kinase